MRVTAAALAGAITLVLASPAQAQAPSAGGAEIWDLSDATAPRHWFTGLRCRPEAIGLPLSRRIAFDTFGADVGCLYGAQQFDYFATVYATKRWPIGAPLQDHVDQTWSEVRARYTGAAELANGERTIETPAGPLAMRELVLGVEGRDTTGERDMSGVTGAWLADVGGWTLKVRLTGYGRDLDWARATADGLMAAAAADMNTARECVDAGAEAAPPLRPDGDALALTLMATMISIHLSDVVPRDAVAARTAGFVCLGAGLQTRSGKLAFAVTPRTATALGEAAGPARGMRLLALGEIRGLADPPMIAVFDMSEDGLLSEGGRLHVVYSFAEASTAYLGPATLPPRESAAYGAADAAESATATAKAR